MFEEDEILVAGSSEAAVGDDQRRALSVELDQRRRVVALLETVPGLAERRQLVPARPHVARARHAVALAPRLGVLVHGLFRPTATWNVSEHRKPSNALDFINEIHYYRATLCVSAVFAIARCSSVRPSRLYIVSSRVVNIAIQYCNTQYCQYHFQYCQSIAILFENMYWYWYCQYFF